MKHLDNIKAGDRVRVRWHGTVYHGAVYVVSNRAAVVDITLANGDERRVVLKADRVLGLL